MEQIERISYRMYYRFGKVRSINQIDEMINQYQERYNVKPKQHILNSIKYWEDIKESINQIN